MRFETPRRCCVARILAQDFTLNIYSEVLKNRRDFSERLVPRVSRTQSIAAQAPHRYLKYNCTTIGGTARHGVAWRANENRNKSATGENPDSRTRKSLRARNEGCAMSFIAAFPAVYRDSLANGKRHNGRTRIGTKSRRDGTRYRQAMPVVSPS